VIVHQQNPDRAGHNSLSRPKAQAINPQ
jgi:hypothetical protein